jgi:hypothetical protein
MANRYPYDRERWGREHGGAYGEPDRGPLERGGDEVRSWFGDDEAARRRRLDEQERDRWEAGARQRWGAGEAWGNPRSYSSDRDYGDRHYGDWGSARERFDRPDRADWSRRDYGWRDRPAMPAYTGVGHGHYAEPGYIGARDYDQQTYGGPSGRPRYGAREWSSVEGWRVPGPHAGRGPRGYQRTDERIREEINERLTAHGLIDATEVDCRVAAGEVTLTGFVDSRAAKRAAEDVAEDVYGVRDVHNELRVRSHASDGGVGRTSVLGLTEAQMQSTQSPAAPAADHGRPRTRT